MFHDRLRSARIYRGYTLQKTADAIGVSVRALQKYESGEIEPNLWGFNNITVRLLSQ